MPARLARTLVAVWALLGGAAPRSQALVLGDGRGAAASDCLIALEVGESSGVMPFGRRELASIQCTDCDPACDTDGAVAANGSCSFEVRACVDVPDVAACAPATLTKARAVVKRRGAAAIDLSPVPAATSFACGGGATITVPLHDRKGASRPGTAQVLLVATADREPRDRDRLLLVCNPRPSGKACPSPPTTTTLPPQVLGTPFGLNTTASPAGPPYFVLHWSFEEGTIPVDTFLVYESIASFSDVRDATLIATGSAAARSADVELPTGTGVHHFRVSAVSFDGLASTLSPELAIDTPPAAEDAHR